MAPLLLVLLLAANKSSLQPPQHGIDSDAPQESRWRRRTAKRRERTEQLLNHIESSSPAAIDAPHVALSPPCIISNSNPAPTTHPRTISLTDDIPTLSNPSIHWDSIDSELDPIRGGKIRPDTPRGLRKRAQVEAFAHVVSELLKCKQSQQQQSKGGVTRRRTTIIDAGSGAGNLAIPLAGLLSSNNQELVRSTKKEDKEDHIIEIVAVDVNEIALQRLDDRANKLSLPHTITIRTLAADLARPNDILQSIAESAPQSSDPNDVIVVSLHACGAASDYAMNLAYKCNNAPFVICPCCTAKSLTKRGTISVNENENENGSNQEEGNAFDMNASFQRSGATNDITYPRSRWLSSILSTLDTTTATPQSLSIENEHHEYHYTTLAKVADIGLGPQTPTQQREHQRRAKTIIELDRLGSSMEDYGYDTRLMRIQHHDPWVYGKGELLLGASRGSLEADVIDRL